jgi:uncharacterized protein
MPDKTSTLPFAPETGTTPEERTMATLAHVLQLFGGWIAPLVIFFIKRQSRFVTFHALQVLLFEGVFLFFTMFAMGAFFVTMMLGTALGSWGKQHDSSKFPIALFVFFGLFMLGFVLVLLLRLVLAVVYGIKASRGEWAEYPLLGGLARRILHIGPGGTIINS